MVDRITRMTIHLVRDIIKVISFRRDNNFIRWIAILVTMASVAVGPVWPPCQGEEEHAWALVAGGGWFPEAAAVCQQIRNRVMMRWRVRRPGQSTVHARGATIHLLWFLLLPVLREYTLACD